MLHGGCSGTFGGSQAELTIPMNYVYFLVQRSKPTEPAGSPGSAAQQAGPESPDGECDGSGGELPDADGLTYHETLNAGGSDDSGDFQLDDSEGDESGDSVGLGDSAGDSEATE